MAEDRVLTREEIADGLRRQLAALVEGGRHGSGVLLGREGTLGQSIGPGDPIPATFDPARGDCLVLAFSLSGVTPRDVVAWTLTKTLELCVQTYLCFPEFAADPRPLSRIPQVVSWCRGFVEAGGLCFLAVRVAPSHRCDEFLPVLSGPEVAVVAGALPAEMLGGPGQRDTMTRLCQQHWLASLDAMKAIGLNTDDPEQFQRCLTALLRASRVPAEDIARFECECSAAARRYGAESDAP